MVVIELIFACIGSGLNLLFNIPQIYITYTSKNVKALSLYTIILRLNANICWLVYGILKKEVLFSITSGVNILSEFLLLVAKHKWGTRREEKIDGSERDGVIN
jgi:uncharacterized protein with PQ loop repeat